MADSGSSMARRLFSICVLIIAVTVLIGALALWFLNRPQPTGDVVGESLQRSASAHNRLQRERLDRLSLIARLLAEDQPLQQALEVDDGDAMTGGLETLRARLGFDLALITDPQGQVLARSDGSSTALGAAARSLLEAPAVEDGVTGYWEQGGLLYYAARQPVVADFDLVGFAVAAFAVDDLLALEIQRIGGSHAAYYSRSAVGPELVGASSQRFALGLQGQVGGLGGPGGELGRVLSDGEAYPRASWSLDGAPWEATLTPLLDAAGEPAGALAVLSPVAPPPGGRWWLPVAAMGAAGLLALLLAAPAVMALARSGATPAKRLAESLEIAARGDYEQRIDSRKAGALAPLSVALNGLLGDLRERRSLEAVGATLSRPAGSGEAVAAARAEKVVLLGVDLRGSAPGLDAQEVLDGLNQDLRRVAGAVRGSGGVFIGNLGARALGAFRGDDAAKAAFAAATEVLTALTAKSNAFDEREPPAVALAAGKVTSGPGALAGCEGQALAGVPLRLLDSLLREADGGEVLLDRQVKGRLEEHLSALGIQPAERRGVLSPQPLAALSLAAVSPLAGEGERPAADLGPGDIFGQRFEILQAVGSGPASAVYRARDRELGELVALKLYRPAGLTDVAQFERLDSGLQSARKLTGEAVARTYDFGVADGLAYLAREWIYGVPMADVLGRIEALPPAAALRAARLLAAALEEAHGEALVHGRLTPSNVFFEPNGRVRVTDFGVSLVAGSTVEVPEGQAIDARSDVYSAAAIVYRLAAGDWPPKEAPPEPDGQLPGTFAEVLVAALRPEPGGRPASGRELRSELAAIRL
ncbi:MAG: cache domain-containing protein [Acidobacteriota bacterium]